MQHNVTITHVQGENEWNTLSDDAKEKLFYLMRVFLTGGVIGNKPTDDRGEVYIYPRTNPNEIAWGYNRPKDGWNAARGIVIAHLHN